MMSMTTTPGVAKPSSSTARELFGLGRAQALGAIRFGDLHEVGEVLHPHFGVAARVEELLPLAHHAEAAVVHDDDLDVQVLGDAGGELLKRHLERAVAGDEHHGAIGVAEGSAHRGGEAVAHGAEAARGEPRAPVLGRVVLRGPHLVLSHVGRANGLAAGDPRELDASAPAA